MALNLKKILSKATSFSELEEGRSAVETEDMIKYYPEGFTIIAAEPVQLENPENGTGYFYDILFKEDTSKFYRTGMVLTKALDELMKACDGDKATFDAELAHGAKVKLTQSKTKSGNKIIVPEFLD